MLDFNNTMDQLARDNSVRCHGHVLRKDRNNVLRRALDIHLKWTWKRGRPKNIWINAVAKRVEKLFRMKVIPVTVQDMDKEFISSMV